MRCVETAGRDDLAKVFVLELRDGPRWRVECVGAVDPAVPRDDKVVLVISSQFGCPVGCSMCDAGGWYAGNLTADELCSQVSYLVRAWATERAASRCPKFKVQFARMGEPSLNPAVLEALRRLPTLVPTAGLIPCVATTAPLAASGWFEELLEVRDCFYRPGHFQLQLSAQSTDENVRDRMIPVPKWTLREAGDFAVRFVRPGDRKVVFNFALARDIPVSAGALAGVLSPAHCIVKLTPLNDTWQARHNGLQSAFSTGDDERVQRLAGELAAHGFTTIVSVGDPQETAMRTSCGQLASLGAPRRWMSGELDAARPWGQPPGPSADPA
jgi:23S rRNA (adenine2503-C2)-methyltransferase